MLREGLLLRAFLFTLGYFFVDPLTFTLLISSVIPKQSPAYCALKKAFSNVLQPICVCLVDEPLIVGGSLHLWSCSLPCTRG